MEQLLGVVGLDAVPYAKSRRDDDYTDRLSHRTTVALLVCFAVLVSTKQFVGNPINCWMPAHFHKDSHDDYANRYQRSGKRVHQLEKRRKSRFVGF